MCAPGWGWIEVSDNKVPSLHLIKTINMIPCVSYVNAIWNFPLPHFEFKYFNLKQQYDIHMIRIKHTSIHHTVQTDTVEKNRQCDLKVCSSVFNGEHENVDSAPSWHELLWVQSTCDCWYKPPRLSLPLCNSELMIIGCCWLHTIQLYCWCSKGQLLTVFHLNGSSQINYEYLKKLINDN